MDAPLQIVGCVLASKPATEWIDAFAALVRRERAVVMSKSAQGATFVRFNAPDLKVVELALEMLRGPSGSVLRFGFAAGTREAPTSEPDTLGLSTRSMVQAADLAAGAGDGEVLVSPQLAVPLIESGLTLRSRQVQLPGGRTLPACTLMPSAQGSRPLVKPAVPLADLGAANAVPPAGESLGQVFRALLGQAEEMARRQSELEARQDAVLGKMTLVDEGQPSARHLSELEAELDAQVARVEARLDLLGRIEQRMGEAQRVATRVERQLAEQAQRRGEIDTLRLSFDTLTQQALAAQKQLDDVAATQRRLLPMTDQVAALTQALAQSQATAAALEARLREVGGEAQGLERALASIGEREAMVHAVKTEVDHIRQVSGTSRADLEFLAERQGEIAKQRALVEDLLGRLQRVDGQLEAVESRRQLIEQVQERASAVTHMVGDMQLKLEMLEEQRVVIDHVGDKLARLDFTLQEAQNTLRALQREREVAERIEQGIKTLRSRSGSMPTA